MNSAELAIDLRPQILKAIDAGYRTIGQIKHNIGVSPATDISIYLDTMLTDEEIEKNSNGTFTAFYRPGQRVKRMWLENGRVETEFDGDAPVRDDRAKAAELGGRAEFNQPFSENGAKLTENRGAIGKQRPESPDMDLAEVERCAREGMTVKKAAEHFGMTLFVFKNRLTAKKGRFAPVREAWYRGRKAAGIEDRGTKKGEKRGPYKAKKKTEDVSPAKKAKKHEYISGVGKNIKDSRVRADSADDQLVFLCQSCGSKFSYWHLNDDGVCKSCMKNIPLDKAAEKDAVTISGPQPRPYLKWPELDAFVQTVKKRQPVRVHHRHIDLKNGGQIVVGFEGNIFDLTPNELLFICDMGERLRTFEQEVAA